MSRRGIAVDAGAPTTNGGRAAPGSLLHPGDDELERVVARRVALLRTSGGEAAATRHPISTRGPVGRASRLPPHWLSAIRQTPRRRAGGPPPHSYLSALPGSTPLALRAGSQQARKAIATSVPTTAA